ncbi:TetR family transcriptional regulator [Pararoseomonas sp. SCSIO 73927]|uniref:TetR family transcriptional regulator n=1 Tax=Pararoseomonas sp. SCSIO 73927 TaxID=3114537 RepID=UPI0030CCE05E
MRDEAAERTQTARAAPRRRLTPAERLPQILEAALEEFSEGGYGGASMAGAAARAGVAKGLIYHYFPGKAELFTAVVRSCIQPVFTEAEKLVAAHAGSNAELLRQLIGLAYLRVGEDVQDGVLFKLLLAEADRFPELGDFYHREVLSRGLALVTGVVRAGIAAGEFRADAAEQPGLAAVLMAPVAMASVWRGMLGPDRAPSPEAMREAQVDLVLRGLAREG